MEADDLLNFNRLNDHYAQDQGEARNNFQRDFDRIIFSSPFRRLQNKTQVFPLPGSVFVHNRLTHTLEVSTVGRSLATLCSRDWESKKFNEHEKAMYWGAAVAAACLAHDIGNPPFGHSGEAAIANFFQRNQQKSWFKPLNEHFKKDFLHYEGNANTFRLLTHSFPQKRPFGFGLTYTVLASLVKYPFSSSYPSKYQLDEKIKFGYFHTENATFNHVFKQFFSVNDEAEEYPSFPRHPFAYLVEAADDICYRIIDLEDAHKLHIIEYQQLEDWFLNLIQNKDLQKTKDELQKILDKNEKVAFLRGRVINQLIYDCKDVFCNNDYKSNLLYTKSLLPPLLDNIPSLRKKILTEIKEYSNEHIYNDRRVVEIELAGNQIINGLLEEFLEGVFTFYENSKDRFAKKIMQLVPEQFKVNPEMQDFNYQQIMHIIDFVAGMTDLFAVEMFHKIKGISFPKLS